MAANNMQELRQRRIFRKLFQVNHRHEINILKLQISGSVMVRN